MRTRALRWLLVALVAATTACGGGSDEASEQPSQAPPDTEVEYVTGYSDGYSTKFAEVRINGVRCMHFRRGDSVGGGGGLSCDWNEDTSPGGDR